MAVNQPRVYNAPGTGFSYKTGPTPAAMGFQTAAAYLGGVLQKQKDLEARKLEEDKRQQEAFRSIITVLGQKERLGPVDGPGLLGTGFGYVEPTQEELAAQRQQELYKEVLPKLAGRGEIGLTPSGGISYDPFTARNQEINRSVLPNLAAQGMLKYDPGNPNAIFGTDFVQVEQPVDVLEQQLTLAKLANYESQIQSRNISTGLESGMLPPGPYSIAYAAEQALAQNPEYQAKVADWASGNTTAKKQADMIKDKTYEHIQEIFSKNRKDRENVIVNYYSSQNEKLDQAKINDLVELKAYAEEKLGRRITVEELYKLDKNRKK